MSRSLLVALAIAIPATAAPPSPTDVAFFEKQIRPVLSEQCWSCHGPKKQTAGLRLDSRTAMLKGGESGPAINEKEPTRSLLLRAIRHEGDIKMPPKTKLPALAIAALETWVNRGAPWPESAARDAPDWRQHWAFQPVANSKVPEVDIVPLTGPRSPIDHFVVAKLKEKGLTLSGEADKRTLIRRATFDLTGLPLTPEEVDAFLKDESAEAYERVVNRLLDSPAYGEHIGRMWLDVARYADTKGYIFFEEPNYPWAYTYRDYVIESFNKDLPYDRFVMEQLAADRLVGEDRRPLRALGFLTVGGHFMNNTHDIIDDRIDVVTRGLMGLTVGCARCHDHKFDPIPTRDYYSLYGVFASSEEPNIQPLFEPPPKTEAFEKFAREMTKREKALRDFVKRKRDELAASQRNRTAEYLMAAHALRDRPGQEDFMLIADGNDLNPKMIVRWQAFLTHMKRTKNAVFGPWHKFAELSDGKFAEKAPATAADLAWANESAARAFLQPPNTMAEVANRYAGLLGNAQARMDASMLAGGVAQLPVDPDVRDVLKDASFPPNIMVGDYGDLDLLPDRPSQDVLQKLRKEMEQWRATGPGAPPRAMALTDSPQPMTPRVFQRGNPYNLGPVVPRQFPECLSTERKPFTDGSGRLELAKAIVDAKNPLTARVFVNRVWQHLFGRGIVTTPGDFGLRGDPPTQPELLDHLAYSFVADGWSVKKLIKGIVLSSTYRQSSQYSVLSTQYSIDPDNTLFWHANRRRLNFEPMRDSLLAVAGKLDHSVGGPSVQNFLAGNATRRTLYAHLDRLNVPGVYRTFDYPSPDSTSAKRSETTVPPQALFMMNHPFVMECAKNLVGRADVASLADQNRKLDRVYAILYGRLPTERERALAAEVLAIDPAKTWPRFAQALLMTNEFLFVD
jgi:Protein of unknown function (DUF1553)/Protein of unknown function (DUF1549)/Planctomycete cytochrome C